MAPIEIPQRDRMPHHFQNFRETHLILETNEEDKDKVLFPEGWQKAKRVAILAKTHNTVQLNNILEKLASNTSLRSLYIHWTDEQFPVILTSFGQLQHLGLVNHALRAVPGDIDNLRHLRTLRMATTSLLGLPSNIGKLKKLKELYLMVHQMECLPKSFTKLTSLEYFGLLIKDMDIRKDWERDYHFPARWKHSSEELVEQLSLFPDLKRLFLGYSSSQHPQGHQSDPLPENFADLHALEELELETLFGLTGLKQVAQMPNLKKIWGNFFVAKDFLSWLQKTFPQGQLVKTEPELFYSGGYYEINASL
ncbi:hypothetical protein BKI52_37995 [marine bacterium AO1-C]|nr:hypothetical protein BKI52_37995 [marine bacterium AO1-C]